MPKESDTLVGLSVGTTKISVIVAEPRSADAIHVIGIGCSPSRGLSKGIITDMKEATQSVMRAVRDATTITDRRITSALVAFNSMDVRSEMTDGMVALGGRDPRQVVVDDIKRVIEAAQSRLSLPGNMLPVHTIPVSYAVDGRVVVQPLEMTGTRLEIMLQTVSVPQTYVQNFITCVRGAGIQVEGLVLKPLAASLGAVTDEEMRAGCISISIGGGSTGLVLYQGGRPFRIMSIPIGGDHIRNDLSSVLNIPLRDAEKLKMRLFVDSEEALKRDGYDIDLAIQVIRARVEELFLDYVRVALAECSPQLFPGGVILSGGVAQTPGIGEMLRDILQMRVRFADPLVYPMPPGRGDLSFASAAGLLRYYNYRKGNSLLFIEPNLGLEDVQPVARREEHEEPPVREPRPPQQQNENSSSGSSGENFSGLLTNMVEKLKDLFLE